MISLKDIVAAYKRDYADYAARELRWFAIQPNLQEAVSMAALARSPSGKRLSHQRRIPGRVLVTARGRLLRILPRLKNCSHFDELHAAVEQETRPIHGIGELFVYDTAVRIGAYLKLLPRQVYVHAGVRRGATNCRLDTTRKRIPMADLPAPLRSLEPYPAEDILCIYKSQLAGATMSCRRC